MLLNFLAGVLGYSWRVPLVVVIIFTLLELLAAAFGYQSYAEKIGLRPPVTEDLTALFFGFLIALAMNYIFWGLGLGLRKIWKNFRGKAGDPTN